MLRLVQINICAFGQPICLEQPKPRNGIERADWQIIQDANHINYQVKHWSSLNTNAIHYNFLQTESAKVGLLTDFLERQENFAPA